MKTWQTGNGVIVRQLLGGRSNSFLIQDRNHNAIVDTGRRYGLKSLLNRIHEADTRTIDYLILTHTHFDHAENAAYLKEHFGLRIIVHQSEAELLKKRKKSYSGRNHSAYPIPRPLICAENTANIPLPARNTRYPCQ